MAKPRDYGLDDPQPRRDFLARLTLSALGVAGCQAKLGTSDVQSGPARLTARVASPTREIEPGEHELVLSAGRNGLLYVPRSYVRGKPAPLVVLLHGAGGSARNFFGSYGPRAEALGAVILAPESRGATWDAVRSEFYRDPPFIDLALKYTFEHCAIDSRRIALAGFSDGATYAISLGLPNGDLFTHIIAYSPGFMRNQPPHGKPPIFVSHGVADAILPIASTSRQIVPALRSRGYAVEYHEFDGGHEVPPAISTQALDWFLRTT